MASYVVKAAIVKVSVGATDGNRVARILREGNPVPDGVAEDLLASLAKRGLIRKVTVRQLAAVPTKAPVVVVDVPGAGDQPPAK